MTEPLSEYIAEGVELVKEGASKMFAAKSIIKKYKLTQSVQTIRKIIAKELNVERHRGLADECEKKVIPIENASAYWVKTDGYSIYVKNDVPEADSFNELREALLDDLKKFAPVYPVIKRDIFEHPHLLIVDPADIHFGKYSTISETGEETSTSTTRKRFNDGIDGLIHKTRGYNFDKIIYVGGNDIVHTDNPFGTTTAGTRQDTDGLWHENYLVAKQATIEAIDKLLTIADVHFIHAPSNHDFMTGFFLADAISSHYSKNQNITFDVTPIHRKYIQYGKSLIGITHGDGAKAIELPDLMKTEAKAAYSLSKYSYWLCHHIHHKVSEAHKRRKKVNLEQDYRDVTVINTGLALTAEDYCYVEYVRSLSGTDRWHYTSGFVHCPKSIEAFIFCPNWGKVNTISHLF